mgnify:CR=1 FL=1
MGAKDVDPNRLTAAQIAAKSFVEEYPAETRIGIVAFGATASLVQSPTHNREDLLRGDRPLPAAARNGDAAARSTSRSRRSFPMPASTSSRSVSQGRVSVANRRRWFAPEPEARGREEGIRAGSAGLVHVGRRSSS